MDPGQRLLVRRSDTSGGDDHAVPAFGLAAVQRFVRGFEACPDGRIRGEASDAERQGERARQAAELGESLFRGGAQALRHVFGSVKLGSFVTSRASGSAECSSVTILWEWKSARPPAA